MLDKSKNTYDKLFKIIKENRDCLSFSDYELECLISKSKSHLFGFELKEKYGFDIDPKIIKQSNHCELETPIYAVNCYIRTWSNSMKVSWSDDGRQPEEGEKLLHIGFSTGAYIFGDYYPTNLFQDFFNELKSYKPKYSDTTNRTLYFSLDSAAKFYNDLPKIWDKYTELNKHNYKKHKAQELRQKLKELED